MPKTTCASCLHVCVRSAVLTRGATAVRGAARIQEGKTPLLNAASECNEEAMQVMQLLIERGAAVNVKDEVRLPLRCARE